MRRVVEGAVIDQLEYFRSHPPRCIKGFIARPTALSDTEFDGHSSLSQLDLDVPSCVIIDAPEHICPMFALSCPCGGEKLFFHGYQWVNPDFGNTTVFLSPLALECQACGKLADLLDTDLHGYDAELGHGTATVRAAGDRAVFSCPECGRHPLDVFIRFEYLDDLFDGDFAEFAGREQELFTWVNVAGKCPKCSQVLAVADYECA